ncbi:MAG: glycoside hydrolase family 15 protein [Armatimonadota bacterium]
MTERDIQERYRAPLCPYLAIGNQRVLVQLDAYCVPQSLQWPRPGGPDRLAWRDPGDEWPYWDELSDEAVCARMPYFEYTDGSIDYLHNAEKIEIDYLEDTNVLVGRYSLPKGAVVEITTFVLPDEDVWVRRFKVTGIGRFVHQSEFFEKAVRGHPMAHMGNINFRGILEAAPRGMYIITSTIPLSQTGNRVAVEVHGERIWDMYMCIASSLSEAAACGDSVLESGFDHLLKETVSADRAWIGRAKEPVNRHPFVLANYRRWLLANRLLLCGDGAMVCGARPFWGFSWPRDSSLIAASFAAAGFLEEARSIVKWHLDNTPESCVHEARYYTDRTPMLLDNRPRQGDNPGFLAWATAFVCRQVWDDLFVGQVKEHLFALADHLLGSKDPETLLPLPESDYWEGIESESISLAVSAAAGLKCAAYVSERLGDHQRASRYKARAEEIQEGIWAHLWNSEKQYIMRSIKPINTDSDVAVCWGIYPFDIFDDADKRVKLAVERVKSDLWNYESGGMLVGQGMPVESLWFYHSAIFLPGIVGIGDRETETEIISSLEKNSCPQGLIPEQVGVNGHLWGCPYFSVTQACMLLYAYYA